MKIRAVLLIFSLLVVYIGPIGGSLMDNLTRESHSHQPTKALRIIDGGLVSYGRCCEGAVNTESREYRRGREG